MGIQATLSFPEQQEDKTPPSAWSREVLRTHWDSGGMGWGHLSSQPSHHKRHTYKHTLASCWRKRGPAHGLLSCILSCIRGRG